jgi:charged multivesicular body protein 3
MLEDTLDMEEDEEIDVEADVEVDKILFELTNGKLGLAGSAGTKLPVRGFNMISIHQYLNIVSQQTQDQLEDEETERTMEQYRQQLNGLLST